MVCPACRPTGSSMPSPVTIELLEALLTGDWDARRGQPGHQPARGQRPGRGAAAVAPRARAAVAGPGRPLVSDVRHRDRRTPVSADTGRSASRRADRREARGQAAEPAPVRRPAAADPGGQGARPRRDRHGRQRPLGEAARAAADGRARGGGGLAVRLRRGRHRAGHQRDQRLRLLHRELAAQPRRGPLPHGLQPRRHPPAARRDARARGAGALGRAAVRGCGAASSRSSRSPRSSPATTTSSR